MAKFFETELHLARLFHAAGERTRSARAAAERPGRGVCLLEHNSGNVHEETFRVRTNLMVTNGG